MKRARRRVARQFALNRGRPRAYPRGSARCARRIRDGRAADAQSSRAIGKCDVSMAYGVFGVYGFVRVMGMIAIVSFMSVQEDAFLLVGEMISFELRQCFVL